MFLKEIFKKVSFDIEVLGLRRIESAGSRWSDEYKSNGILDLHDTRRNYSGRLRKKLSKESDWSSLFKSWNRSLKKLELNKREVKDNKLVYSVIYKLIEELSKHFYKSIKYLCKISCVSTSGYYNYLKYYDIRKQCEKDDKKIRDIILKSFNYKGFKKGSRSIKMTLENKFGINFNRKEFKE